MIRRKCQSHSPGTPGRIVLRAEQTGLAVLYEPFGFDLALSYLYLLPIFRFTGHTGHQPLATTLPPLFTRHSPLPPTSRPTSGFRSCTDPPPLVTTCVTDPELRKNERGPIWPTKPSILIIHRTGRFLRTIPSVPPRSPPA